MSTPSRLGLLTLLAVVLSSTTAIGVTYQWSQRFGDGADQIPTAVAMDNSGNIIIVGRFAGSVNFGGGAMACAGSDCVFLTKLDRFGNHMWSHTLGDSMEYNTNKLSTDVNGNVLIANDFKGTVDFGGGPISMVGFRDGVIGKFDALGNHVWSRGFGGVNSLVEVKAACSDGSGNLYVVGTFTGNIDFGEALMSADPFSTNMYIVKFNSSGDHVWSHRFNGSLVEVAGIAASPTGEVYLTGYHGGTFDFGGGGITADVLNVFLVKYDSGGNHAWSHTFGATGTLQHSYDVAVDLWGNVFITGDFRDPLNLGGGNIVSAGGWDVFVAKFDGSGNHIWSQPFGDGSTQRAYTVTADASGNVTVGGHFFGVVDFGGGTITGDPIDFFAARFGPTGTHLWTQRFDVDNLGLPNDKEYSISAAANIYGELAFAGSFKDGVDCGGGNLSGNGLWDVFVARFESVSTGVRPQMVARALRAHPNPFNPQTMLTYTVREAAHVRLSVYDVTGRRVRTLVDGWTDAGSHSTPWNGRNDTGAGVGTGVYFVRLDAAGLTETIRVVLLK